MKKAKFHFSVYTNYIDYMSELKYLVMATQENGTSQTNGWCHSAHNHLWYTVYVFVCESKLKICYL